MSANVDERALREIYLPHFKKCVDAGAMAMMSAYNRVNGTYCDLNKHLLTDILRDEWGFEGFVMSDFVSGVHDCVGSYDAGMDMEMPWKTHHKKAEKLIKEEKMDEKLINQASRRILRSLLSINSKLKPQPKSISKCKEHANLAREAATKGTVLLKNNGVLPVSLNQKIAVVGPFADAINTGDHGSSFIWCKDGITPYQGLKNVYKDVSVYNGLETDPALKAAKNADVVVVCVGCDRFTEGELLENKIETLEKDPSKKSGGDRDSLHLRSEELSIIKALKDAGKKVIVSMITGSVFVTSDFEDSVDGVFLSFYGGVHAGTALADLISG
ncbi:MAG: glycoside hydrolase family 3 C-terminal domain-containing protein, partial [Christensenellaceae bacterium]